MTTQNPKCIHDFPSSLKSLGKNGLPYGVNGVQEPKETNPAVDETGKNCDREQFNPNLWFLEGTFGGKAERKCTIPTTRAIFFPLLCMKSFLLKAET
jgi:hypothetical protein